MNKAAGRYLLPHLSLLLQVEDQWLDGYSFHRLPNDIVLWNIESNVAKAMGVFFLKRYFLPPHLHSRFYRDLY